MKRFSGSSIIKMSNTRFHVTFEIYRKPLVCLIVIYFDTEAYLDNNCDDKGVEEFFGPDNEYNAKTRIFRYKQI